MALGGTVPVNWVRQISDCNSASASVAWTCSNPSLLDLDLRPYVPGSSDGACGGSISGDCTSSLSSSSSAYDDGSVDVIACDADDKDCRGSHFFSGLFESPSVTQGGHHQLSH